LKLYIHQADSLYRLKRILLFGSTFL